MDTSSTTKPDRVQSHPVLRNLQYSPIKEQDEQYIVLWDPSGVSIERLVLPLNYFFVVQHFDGQHSLDQIGALYLNRFGEFLLPERLHRLVVELEAKLFLEGPASEAAKEARRRAFRQGPVRRAAHAGKSYEAEGFKLRRQIESWYQSKEGPEQKPSPNKGKRIKGLVAPAYDLKQAGPIYAWAYKELNEAESPDVFVLLAPCHAGMDSLFAFTDKDFETPLGTVPVNKPMLEHLQRHGEEFFTDDAAHEQEHALEFQLPLLLDAVGKQRPCTIVPILCSFSAQDLKEPTVRTGIDRIVDLLRHASSEAEVEPCVIASADLAHIGMRYGDAAPPTDFSFHRCMQQDLAMLKFVEDLKPEEFASFIQQEGDSRRITGFAPIYSLLRMITAESGQVHRYDRGITDQYNSTVTYASMAFF
ncbi:MAG: AmmeMemoRadiSam system protein B [Nitrospiraceae bacterium]